MAKQVPKVVSPTRTKNEIYQAYQAALEQLQSNQVDSPQDQKTKQEEHHVVENALKLSPSSIIQDLGSLKLSLLQTVDHLSDHLTREFEKLETLQKAISFEKAHLEEVYQIKENTQTLSALMAAQKQQREEFERHMEEQRRSFEEQMNLTKNDWEKQQKVLEEEFKEKKALFEKTHQRTEEEYLYKVQRERQKEQDAYEAEKKIYEEERQQTLATLAEQENHLKQREEEFKELQDKVASFPSLLKEKIGEAEKALQKRLETDYNHAQALREKEVEGLQNLKSQQIDTLEKKIKEQEDLIQHLMQKAERAVTQVETIACQALQASSQRFHVVKAGENE